MLNEKACDPEIYLSGSLVFTTHTIPSKKINEWVQKIERLSQQPVDWHYVGGRAAIRALGNLEAVRAAIRREMPSHDALFNAEMEKLGLQGYQDPPRPDWW